MSKLELPIRAFVEDYVRRAFPKVDFGRGSAANDLIIKAFAALMQPMRHEIDVIKVNQSLSNWRYQRPEDLDQIAANWGRYRQQGGRSQGTVRMFFDKALEFQFSELEFFTADGLTFNLVSPVTITSTDLFQRRITIGGGENRYFFDVTVRSNGIGSRFALPAGSIAGVRNRPPSVVSVEQIEDFQVTAPNESNFDLVNSMFKNIGMRNLVSRSSIRAPLLDNFPGLLDMYIAGNGHVSMVRDLVDVTLPTGPVRLHAGGMTDIWLSTATLQRKQITLSYVPSSRRIKLVSTAQSQEQELIFDFQRGIVTLEGYFQNPEVGAYEVDESVSLTFDMQDVPLKTFIINRVDRFRNAIAAKDIIAGNELMTLPGAAGYSNLSADLVGLNFRRADIHVGDTVQVDGKHRRVTKLSGRVFESSPAPVKIGEYLFLGAPLAPGARVIALSDIHLLARVNDRLTVMSSAAAAMYSVLKLAPNSVTIGRLDSRLTITDNVAHLTNANLRVLTVTGPGATQPKHALDLANTSYVYFGQDAGFDDTKFYKIASVSPGITESTIEIIDPSNATSALTTDVQIIGGLTGSLPVDTTLILERDDQSYFGQASKFSVPNTHTRYANELGAAVPAGVDVLDVLGIGMSTAVGDVVIFFDINVPTTALSASGGDGERFSVVVTQVINSDNVRFQPALPFELPIGARFAVQKNNLSLATAVVDSVDPINNDITFNAFPIGLGDGVGLIIKSAAKRFVVMASSAGSTKTLKFKPPAYVRTITLNSTGYLAPTIAAKGLVVKDVVGGYQGILHNFDNVSRTWLVIPSTPGDIFDNSTNAITIVGSTATGIQSVISTGPTPVGYVPSVVGDLGSFVRQGSSTGVLVNYNNALFEWYVKPLGDSDTFSDLTLLTFVDFSSGGSPVPAHGQGTLSSTPGPAGIAAGPVTLTLDIPIDFAAATSLQFFSRFSSSGCNFDDQNLVVDPNPAYTPAGLFSTVNPATDQVALLAGIDVGLLTVDKVDPLSLRLNEAVAPDVVRFPNTPGATQFVLTSPIAQGETIIGQTGIGRWAAPGRCLLIDGPSGKRLLPIFQPLSVNSLQLSGGMPITIYPGQGYTWEVVDALHLPYWIVEESRIRQYRMFRTPSVGDLSHNGTSGSTNLSQPTHFFDVNVDFGALLVAQDLAAGNVVLAIDSGASAATAFIPITSVISTNTIALASANFTTTEGAISYRILIRNGSRSQEKWLDGFIAPNASKNTIALFANPGNILRNNSLNQWVLDITPSASWDGAGAPGPVNFTMPNLRMTSFTVLQDALYLISRRVGVADNIAIAETSAGLTVTGLTGGSVSTRAYGSIVFTANPVGGDTLSVSMFGVSKVYEFVVFPALPVPGRVGVNIGATKEATCTNLLAALIAQNYPADIFFQVNVVIDKVATHFGPLAGTDAFNSGGFTLPYGTPIRCMLRNVNRVDADAMTGMAQNTFNYYSSEFIGLPVVKIVAVEALDASTLEPVRAVDYSFDVEDAGLRYSAKETNVLVINDLDVVFKPLRLTYVTDPTVGQVDAYINEDDTRVLNANQLAKRMETIAVSIQASVRTSLASNEVGSLLANFVNTRRSTLQLSKADIIKALYDNKEVTYVEIQSLKLDAVFYALDGTVTNYRDVAEVFGSETACYIAENIFVTKL